MDIRELARLGAVERMKELRDEAARLLKAFPDLKQQVPAQYRAAHARAVNRIADAVAADLNVSQDTATRIAKRSGAAWSAARKAAQSQRMKKMWKQGKFSR